MSKKLKIQAWEQHYTGAKEKEFYSIRRIDLLTISISGACIYIVFEILRFINSAESEIGMDSCTILLKISAVSSVIAIAVNFLSQISGYHANKYEAQYSREVIDQMEDNEEDESKLDKIDLKSQFFSNLTSLSNIASTIFMTIGIIILVIYNLITF